MFISFNYAKSANPVKIALNRQRWVDAPISYTWIMLHSFTTVRFITKHVLTRYGRLLHVKPL